MNFDAEIRRTSQIKRVSLDNEYQITLITDDSSIMDLGKLPPDVMVSVTITVKSEKSEESKNA